MHKRTFLKFMAAATLSATAMTGIAHAEMAGEITEPVTITFYNYNLATASAGADATLEMIAKFEEENPLITVETVGVPSNEIITRLQADMAAGMQPDVAQLVFRDLIYLASDLGAQPLEDLAGPEGYAELVDGLIPRGVDLGKVDDKTYGLAYTFSTPILYYNADLFREAGLDPDQPPKTWAEVKAAAEAIVEKTDADGFFPGAYGPADGTFVYQGILMSNGGNVRDGNSLTFANAEGIEAVQMLRDMVESGAHARLDPANPHEAMAAGNLGMYLYTSALQNSLSTSAEGNWELRVAGMPAFGDKPTAPTNSGSALYAFSQDPVKQRAAYELMKFLTSDYGYTIITSKIGYLPLRLDIVVVEGDGHRFGDLASHFGMGNPTVPDDHLFSDTSATLARVLELIGTMDTKPSFIIASGDLTNRGDADSYRQLKSIMAATDLPVVYAIGNHDTRPGFYEGMLGRPELGRAPYDHDQVIAGVHIITLDTTTPGQIGGALEDVQFSWLESRLDAHAGHPKLIVMHHAPALGDTPPWDHWRTVEFSQSQRLGALLKGRNILAILSGHIHHDRFSVWHGIPVIVGMGQHAATDILTSGILRMVEGASFGIGTVRSSGLTMALVPLPQTRRELNRYDLSMLRQKQEEALAEATK